MSVIANFKKRRDSKTAVFTGTANITITPEAEALALLACLLGCDESEAIEKARKAAEQKARFVTLGIDFASGEDKTVTAQVTTDDAGNITDITESVNDAADSVHQASDSVNHAADSVSHAADKVDQSASAIDDSASNINDSASDLAYSADSIANAANDIKEATLDLKKPSAAPKSSPGVKKDKAENNSKK